ncbi:hypothetical protein HGA88_01070 [Candidatus Roizmanbacteria bacterium]|nr:hypothetical protein [Candidatus Roizmanbacteria bacterium]
MNLNLTISKSQIYKIRSILHAIPLHKVVFGLSLLLSIVATIVYLKQDLILAYGDAESHLNIAKRITQSITPGFAQLGGIWLPIPHLFMVPFVFFDPLWRTGLAGSLVSGISFVISSLFVYKLAFLLTRNSLASFFAALVFMLNPNILYLQSTPMTEMLLIMFFLLSSYYYISYIKNERRLSSLLLASFFGFCAVLTRYDGWFLVLFEALILIGVHLSKHERWQKIEGKFILFSTLAFFGAVLWMLWDFLILGNPFYFITSEFSAHTQQLNWLQRGELPAYHNLPLAVLYYMVTVMSNSGVFIFLISIFGFIFFIKNNKNLYRYAISGVLLVPIFFNTFTLFAGQSVIFIPHLTPISFEWRLFNVRYGSLALPAIAFFCAYALYRCKSLGPKFLIFILFILQFGLYFVGYSQIITISDGVYGLSHAKRPDAENFIVKHYDSGKVLIDDYARTLSIIRSGIPMQNIIYVGNKPYWENALREPEHYVTWIIMQKDDAVWKNLYGTPEAQGRLYNSYQKVYTSPQILIFKKTTR